MADLSKLSDADLAALSSGNLKGVSDAGLSVLAGGIATQSPVVQSPTDDGGSWLDKVKGGIASAPINMYLGAKQYFGSLDPVEQKVLQYNKQAEKDAPVSSFLSNVATLAPTMLIPGANTIAGSALIGAGTGSLQPVEGDQTFANIAKGKLLSSGIGAVGGAAGQWLGNKIGTAIQNRLASQESQSAADAVNNSVRDASLSAGQAAGYKVPPSSVNPTFLGNRLESIAGKAAIKQQLIAENQGVTNQLAKKAIGIAEDTPLSADSVDAVRKAAYGPYREVSELPAVAKDSLGTSWGSPAKDLDALKQARADASEWFNAYNRSANPADLAKAKGFAATAETLEKNLEGYAESAGKSSLVQALRDSRKKIAQTYTVERALNPATGDVNAQVLARLYNKQKPLSDGLDTIGQFAAAFPNFTRAAATNPAAGVSKSEALSGALLGTGAAAATGHPSGALAALIPMLMHPARALATSSIMQPVPTYGAGAATKAAANTLTPETISLLSRALLQYNAPGLAAQ